MALNAVLVDTCILIDIERGKTKFSDLNYQSLYIAPIVEMEFIQGARNKAELNKILLLLEQFKVLDINSHIFDLAKQIMISFNLSHTLKLNDAIIAASALIYDLPILTTNIKDYRFIPQIQIV